MERGTNEEPVEKAERSFGSLGTDAWKVTIHSGPKSFCSMGLALGLLRLRYHATLRAPAPAARSPRLTIALQYRNKPRNAQRRHSFIHL